jgi:hypothetical protein
MAPKGCIEGDLRQYTRPEWGPLQGLLASDELVSHFMWMHDVELADGTILNAYKHRWTRQYLHLANDGRTFYSLGEDGYRELEPHLALGHVFAHWDCCEPTVEERTALRAVLLKALIESK